MTQKRVKGRRRTKRDNMGYFHFALNYNLRIILSPSSTAVLGVMQVNNHFNVGKILLNILARNNRLMEMIMQINRNIIINADRCRNVASFINDCRAANRREGQCTGNNTRFVLNRRAQKVYVRAVKSIDPKSEIFIPYGAQYWRDKAKYERFLLRQQRNAETKRILHLY